MIRPTTNGPPWDVDPVLVVVTVAASLEIEPVEGIAARQLESEVPQVEPYAAREALLVVEELMASDMTVGSEVRVVVPIEAGIDAQWPGRDLCSPQL
jgi:hypothetical protein